MNPAIAYYRVSTARQGQTGYGLDAQRAIVESYARSNGFEIVGEYTEVESGRNDDRPQVAAAIAECKRRGATLIVAKMDRLARSVKFLGDLQESGIGFRACDVPGANELVIGIMAVIAQNEAKVISERTRAGIHAAMARGVKWGQSGKNQTVEHLTEMRAKSAALRGQKATDRRRALLPTVQKAKAKYGTLQATADALNQAGTPSAGRPGTRWYPATVQRVLKSIDRESFYDV